MPGACTIRERVRAACGGIAPWRQRLDRAFLAVIEAVLGWSAAHWLLLTNATVALVLAGAVAAPILRAAGLAAPSNAIHTVYLVLCPQRPTHSYFLFGYQLALEQREIAMYAAQLVGGLTYGSLRHRICGLDWRFFVLWSLPMAWDGLSQTVGLRDSDWFTRTWTGGLFNLGLVLWAYPYLDRVLAVRQRRRSARPAPPFLPVGSALERGSP